MDPMSEPARVFADRLYPGDWRVEGIDDHGGVGVTVFNDRGIEPHIPILINTRRELILTVWRGSETARGGAAASRPSERRNEYWCGCAASRRRARGSRTAIPAETPPPTQARQTDTTNRNPPSHGRRRAPHSRPPTAGPRA